MCEEGGADAEGGAPMTREYVQMGKRVHLVLNGSHRTACGKIITSVLVRNEAMNRDEWAPRPRMAEGSATCGVCGRIVYAEAQKDLDAKYGKGSTLEPKQKAMWRRGRR